MGSLLSNKKMSRVEKRIIGIVGTGLVDDRLVAELGIQRQIRATVRNRVLVKKDSSCQGLDWEGNVLVVPGGISSSPWNL